MTTTPSPPADPQTIERQQPDTHTVTEADLAAVFETWLDDYLDDPDSYEDEYGAPLEYGDACAQHFVRILTNLRAAT